MPELTDKECQACAEAEEPLKGEELTDLQSKLDDGWDVVDEHHLEKKYEFGNFREALNFVNEVGELAEEEFHHPDITFGWGYAEVTIWTHNVGGLTEADFVFAAKTDQLQQDA